MKCEKCGAELYGTIFIDMERKIYNEYTIMHPIKVPYKYYECDCSYKNYFE